MFSRLNILWAKTIRQGTWIKHHPIIEVILVSFRGTFGDRADVQVTLLTTVVSFLNLYTRMGGTEFVASVSPMKSHVMCLFNIQLFAECREDSTSSLCVDDPREIAQAVWPIAMALLIKGALTIVTFGIKLPGELALASRDSDANDAAGIFIPSLVVGACAGRISGLGMEWLEYTRPHWPIFGVCRDTQCVVPGMYAMVSDRSSTLLHYFFLC